MRRRADDWINATHILKVADYDKPARTRILEREVQKGVHEKVQGGYGKYHGYRSRRVAIWRSATASCTRCAPSSTTSLATGARRLRRSMPRLRRIV
jgi:hypothetical protein